MRAVQWLLLGLGLAGAAVAAPLAWPGIGAAHLPETTPPPAATAASGPTPGEAYRWRPVAIGGGGFIVGLAGDASGQTLLARTDVHGAYLWRPEQDRWVQLATAMAMPPSWRRPASMHGGVFGIAAAPSDPRRLYMAAKGTVFRSEDRGASWHAPEGGPFPLRFGAGSRFMRSDPVIAVSPRDPDLVFFGTAFDGLVRSSDGGRTWRAAAGLPAASGSQAQAAAARPVLVWFVPGKADSREVWAMAPGAGMFRSADGGATFRPLRGGAGPRGLGAGAFAADGSFFGADPEAKTLWRYRQGRWTDLAAEGDITSGRYVALAINPRNGEIFAFEHNGRAHRSSDGGARWSRLGVGARAGEGDPPWLRIADHPFFAVAQVMFDPAVPDRLWAATGTGVFRADLPRGARKVEWVSQSRGIEELVANDVVQAPGHAPLFAAWDFGIHVKPDLDAFSTGYGPRERVLIAAQQLALTPADPDFVVTNASDTRACCAEDGGAVLAGYSEDAGRTWHRFATLPRPPGTRAGDPWAMAWGTIAVSSGDRDNIVWMPSLNRAPFFTRDRGRSWTRVRFPGETPPFTGSHRAKHLQRKVLVADPVKSGTFYLVHSGNPANRRLQGLWRSQDGGGTWTRLFAGEIAPMSADAAKLRAMPGREGELFFTSALEGTHDSRLRRSSDGGTTWRIVPGVDRVDDIAFGKAAQGADAPAIYLSGFVGGDYGIWRSIDDGRSWARIAVFPIGRLDRVVVLGADPRAFGRIYIGWQGSGWTYGEPAGCHPAPLAAFATEECYRVDEPLVP